MRSSNTLVLRIAPELGRITVEERTGNVVSCKEITSDALRGCIRDSVVHHGYESGFLPPHCLSVDLTEKGASVVVWYPKTCADISFYETPYPDFPIPRLVFAYHRSYEGKISGCRIGVVEDETPRPTTPMYHYPFSNVGEFSGSLCIGANELPTYKSLLKTATLPGLLLSIPNNLHEFNREHNRLDMEYQPSSRLAVADAFRSATGDIYERKVLETPEGPLCFKVYCRDNRAGKNVISRELVKETVRENTNDYKKLANISYDKKSGVFSYDNLAFDPHVDPLGYCLQARELFELYQRCAGRKQIETLLENYLDSLHAVKVVSHGKVYFIPRDYMAQVALFEDFVESLETHNRNANPLRPPLDSNSMFVVDDEKQRSKMAAAFYRTVRREIQEYQERANHLIQVGSQSPAIMERMVLRIQGLEQKKHHYEEVLQRELHDVDDEFSTLRYLSQELQIRTRGIRAQKKNAA